MQSKASMRITEYGRQSVKTDDFALILGELVAAGINDGMPEEELGSKLKVYTAMRLCMKPGNTVSASPDGIAEILSNHAEEVSKAIEDACKLGRKKNLQTRLVTPIESEKLDAWENRCRASM